MNYFYVEPEVAGGLGENTVIDGPVHPPIVTKLHYHFDGWLGDVLLESFPAFILTENAMHELSAIGVTGVTFGEAETTTSDLFNEMYPHRSLPKFVWLQVVGLAGQDDFGFARDYRLVASQRAVAQLERLGIANAQVTPFSDKLNGQT